MKSKSGIIVIVSIALLIILLYIIFPKGDSNFWGKGYSLEGEEPFDLNYTIDFIQKVYPNQEFIVPDSSIGKTLQFWKDTVRSNYMHIGSYMYMDSMARAEFKDYIIRGNTAIFITERTPAELLDIANNGECIYYLKEGYHKLRDTILRANFTHSDLQSDQDFRFEARNKRGPIYFDWQYFDPNLFCEDNYSFERVGLANDSLCNFIRLSMGDGFIYLHSNPILFTNYFVVQEQGAEYIRNAIAHLNEGPIIYENKNYHEQSFLGNSGSSSSNYMDKSDGPFKYILSQESFRWALYTILGLLIMYIVFGIRRKQSPIPVQRLAENSSIEYVETISELYFQSKGRDKIAQYLFEQYYDFIKSRYQLVRSDDKLKFLNKLKLKSEVPLYHLKNIDELDATRIHKMEVGQDDLIEYYKKLNFFYDKCK